MNMKKQFFKLQRKWIPDIEEKRFMVMNTEERYVMTPTSLSVKGRVTN